MLCRMEVDALLIGGLVVLKGCLNAKVKTTSEKTNSAPELRILSERYSCKRIEVRRKVSVREC